MSDIGEWLTARAMTEPDLGNWHDATEAILEQGPPEEGPCYACKVLGDCMRHAPPIDELWEAWLEPGPWSDLPMRIETT